MHGEEPLWGGHLGTLAPWCCFFLPGLGPCRDAQLSSWLKLFRVHELFSEMEAVGVPVSGTHFPGH